jgi:hypothetical protein
MKLTGGAGGGLGKQYDYKTLELLLLKRKR